jgi:hypothetical protein
MKPIFAISFLQGQGNRPLSRLSCEDSSFADLSRQSNERHYALCAALPWPHGYGRKPTLLGRAAPAMLQ